MLIGILQLDLKIGDALNLKDKRKIVRSLKDKWHHHHNVSAAEVDFHDHPQHALIGVAMVGSDARQLESSLAKLVESVKRERYAELLDFRIEVVSGRD
ncbi:MAG TPA: DUF503 domain-containing protein [Phycisphaerae bacterium]|nr:DUF503 domain-containing protein [Phycisphaerae bacterium]